MEQTQQEERFTELEIRIAFQERRLAELDETVLAQGRVIDELYGNLQAVEEALKRMRSESSGGPVLGAFAEDDPVPSSG
jgi:uncharacterized coiled-coil protein SlyX